MKTKKSKRRLALNKISIAHLDKDKINQVKPGLPPIKGGILDGSYMPDTCKTRAIPPCPLVCLNCHYAECNDCTVTQ